MAFIKSNLGSGGGSGDIIPEHYVAVGAYVSSATTNKVSTAKIEQTASKNSICTVILSRCTANNSSKLSAYVTKNGEDIPYVTSSMHNENNRARYAYYTIEVKKGDVIVAYNSATLSDSGANSAYMAFV